MTNPDIKQALGYVLCEPTDDGIALYADGVDITKEVGGGGLSLVSGAGSDTAKLMQNGEDVTQGVKDVIGGGGVTVVAFTLQGSEGELTVTADMTPSQVLEKMKAGPVVGVLTGTDGESEIDAPLGQAVVVPIDGWISQVDVAFIFWSAVQLLPAYSIRSNGTGWRFDLGV